MMYLCQSHVYDIASYIKIDVLYSSDLMFVCGSYIDTKN